MNDPINNEQLNNLRDLNHTLSSNLQELRYSTLDSDELRDLVSDSIRTRIRLMGEILEEVPEPEGGEA